MGLKDLLSKTESLIGLDFGSTGLKLVEIDISAEPPVLTRAAVKPIKFDPFSNNALVKIDQLAEEIAEFISSQGIKDKRVVVAVPAPSSFTKRVKIAAETMAELAQNIQFEAQNYIPHSLDAVRMDYYAIKSAGKGQIDCLVVAVKNEVIDAILDTLSVANLDPAVVDVDYFAIQNVFETNYPEYSDKTCALLNIGARFSSITIVKAGAPLFTGDVSVGGKQVSEALVQGLGVSFEKAEQIKREPIGDSSDDFITQGLMEKSLESMAVEFNRQLSFFWNASGADEGIEKIFLSGGGAALRGLPEAIKEKTGIETEILNPLRQLKLDPEVDAKATAEISTSLALAIGLGLRQPGDKVEPEIDE